MERKSEESTLAMRVKTEGAGQIDGTGRRGGSNGARKMVEEDGKRRIATCDTMPVVVVGSCLSRIFEMGTECERDAL